MVYGCKQTNIHTHVKCRGASVEHVQAHPYIGFSYQLRVQLLKEPDLLWLKLVRMPQDWHSQFTFTQMIETQKRMHYSSLFY